MNVRHTADVFLSSANHLAGFTRALRTRRWILALFYLPLFSLLLREQTGVGQTPNSPGIAPFSTQGGSAYDTINLSSGGIIFNFPLRTKSGPVPLSFSLHSAPALIVTSGTTFNWFLASGGGSIESGGAMGLSDGTNMLNITATYTPVAETCQPSYGVTDNYFQYNDVGIIDETGASHPLDAPSLSYNPCNQTYSSPLQSSWITADGSGYTAVLTSLGAQTPPYFTVYDRSGNKAAMTTAGANFISTVTTPNGLTTNFTYYSESNPLTTQYQDALGQTVLTNTYQDSFVPVRYNYLDGSGNTESVNEYETSYTFGTSFGCPSVSEGYPTTISLATTFALPDGRAYTISYEPTPGSPSKTTGRVASIGIPGGGSITYTYTGGTNNTGIYCGQNPSNTPILTRTINDAEGHKSVWTYTFSAMPHPYSNTVTQVVDPSNNLTVYHFSAGYETEQQTYQGPTATAGSLLKTVVTCYNGSFTNCTNISINPPYFRVSQTDVYTSYNNGTSSLVETVLNTAGLPTDVKQYDYGAAMPPSGNPLAETKITYGSWTGSACNAISPYILDHVCERQVYDSSQTLVSDERDTYNSTGNLTAKAQLVSGSTYLTSSTTYNSNGTPINSTDPNGNVTTYTFGACNGLLPTKTTAGGLSTQETWDCNGAVVKSATGANAADVTTYTYSDPFYRLTQTTHADGGTVTQCYSDVGGISCTFSSTINSTTTSVTATPNPTQVSVETSDGLGRAISSKDASGATIDTTYDAVGNVSSVSNPYFTKASPFYVTSYSYDALGRLLNQCQPDNAPLGATNCVPNNSYQSSSYSTNQTTFTDEKQNAWTRIEDALGRLTQVTEPLATKTTYTYDGLGNLKRVHQPGGAGDTARADRTFNYDGLSRLTSSSSPEAGSTTFAYRTTANSLCSGNASDVCVRTDARGITTTYVYDALNRPTGKGYSDGTPSVTLSYDQTGLWGAGGCGGTGFVQCNTTGRLSYMSTSNNTASVFGYDAMGRIIMKSSCIASICSSDRIDQFFSYDLSGNETGYDYGKIVGRSSYFGGHGLTYDSAGRLQSLTYAATTTATPSAMFTATSYGPVGLLRSTLGNGFGETRSYDVRMRQESYTVLNSATASVPASFSGSVDGFENNDVVRFPNQSIPATSLPENGTLRVWGWVGTAQSCPVASVQVYIDATPIGAASLGGLRPDVQQVSYNNDGKHAACGYNFVGSIGSTAPGNHTVSVYATDASGNVWPIAMTSNAIVVTSDPPPTAALDSTSGSSIVAGGLLGLGGWAIDSQMHAPVGSVKILIDGQPVGYATLGVARPDVASAYGDSRYTNSGWGFSGGIGGIALGQHTASAIAYDSGGQIFSMAPISFTVVADTSKATGFFDWVQNIVDGTLVLPMGATIQAQGWAGETSNTASCASSISRVDVLLDGNFLGQAQLGISRTDVATKNANSSCSTSGWKFVGPITNVDPGMHVLTARAFDPSGGSVLLSPDGATPIEILVNAELSPASVATTSPSQYAWSLGFEPNGNVGYSSDSVNGSYTYLYDSLNRLAAAGSSVNAYEWNYDSFGNRTAQIVTQGSGVNMYQTFSTNTNRPDGQAFDAAGNALSTGGAAPLSLTYDAEGRISAAGSTSYVYDAMGQRVAKYVSGTMSEAYLYDNAGHAVTEFNGSFGINRREVYAGSKHLASFDEAGNLTYVLADWLGTERARVTNSGTLCQTITSQPFGDNEQISGNCYPSSAFFTGKERDAESGLDNFGARYMSSNIGRFMSPDYSDTPDPVPFGDLSNPQSLNLYSYASNNPLSFSDPDGHCNETTSSTLLFNGTAQLISEWFSGLCDQNLNGLLDGLSSAGSRLAQGLSQAAQQVSSIVHTPGGAGCLAASTAAGSMAGSGAAAGPGLVGLAAGGGGVLVTEPLALTIGGAGGAGAGFVAGMTACPGGAANGGGGSGGGGGGLSGKAKSKLGNLANRAGEKVRDVIRSRGGSGSNVNRVGQWADRTLGEAAEAAARGDSSAETAVKIAKQAGRLGQQY